MRVGLFYQIQVPKPWTPSSESQRIYEALDQIPYAEQMGFASVWFSEHHFRPVWSHNSAPDLTLAAVRGYPETFSHGRDAIKPHPGGNEMQGDHTGRAYSA